MEVGLGCRIAIALTDGTGRARQACHLSADLRTAAQVTCTCGDVVGSALESSDGTSRKAGAFYTALAGAGDCAPRWQLEFLGKEKCTAVGVPEAVVRMYQEAERRGRERFGQLCPSRSEEHTSELQSRE